MAKKSAKKRATVKGSKPANTPSGGRTRTVITTAQTYSSSETVLTVLFFILSLVFFSMAYYYFQ